MFRLSITDQRGSRRVFVDRDQLVLGRIETADLQIKDPAASRNHCMLRIEGDRALLLDLGSQNGTEVRGQRIQECVVSPGTVVRIGESTIVIEAYGQLARPQGVSSPATTSRPAAAPPRPRPVAASQPAASAAAAAGVSWSGSLAGLMGQPKSGGGGALVLEPTPQPPPAEAEAPQTRPASTGDFAREVRAILARTPWYMISAVVHLAILLLLDLFMTVVQEPVVAAPLAAELAPPGPEVEKIHEVVPPEDPELEPDTDSKAFVEPVLPTEEETPPQDEFPLPPTDPKDKSIGIDRMASQKLPVKLKRNKTPVPTGAVRGPDKANKEAVRYIETGDGLKGLRNGDKHGFLPDDIVVVDGDFDHMHKVIDLYNELPDVEIPYLRVKKEHFGKSGFRLRKRQTLFVNCMHQPRGKLAKRIVKTVRTFVRNGGWLLASDWSVDLWVAKAFEGKLKLLPDTRQLGDIVVPVERTPAGVRSPLLEGVFQGPELKWWLESASTMFKSDKRAVQVLVKSRDLGRRFGSNEVVITFPFGQGRVIHLLGHFWQEGGNLPGVTGMQRIILNVLKARRRAR